MSPWVNNFLISKNFNTKKDAEFRRHLFKASVWRRACHCLGTNWTSFAVTSSVLPSCVCVCVRAFSNPLLGARVCSCLGEMSVSLLLTEQAESCLSCLLSLSIETSLYLSHYSPSLSVSLSLHCTAVRAGVTPLTICSLIANIRVHFLQHWSGTEGWRRG